MSANESIAVIMPAYRAAATINYALASVAAQTLTPTEVVVYDDCSTDDTLEIARVWEDRLPIRIAQGDRNLGAGPARRAAIDASTSDLIALLDADDYWFPDHLETMVATWRTTHDGLASADPLRWISGRALGALPLSAGSSVPPPGEQLAWMLRGNQLSTSTMFSRQRYEHVGGFRAQFRVGEDWDLWIRMVRAGAVVARAGHPTLLYRLHEQSTLSRDEGVSDIIGVLDATAADGPFASDAERRGHRTGLRRAHAHKNLADAYAAAAEGRTMTARVAGLKATRGVRSVALRGLAMAVAPRAIARRREAVRYETDTWMKRQGPGGPA